MTGDLDNLRVVLVATRNPLNIGAAARAMSNFGFSSLRLVNPYAVAFREARCRSGEPGRLLVPRLAPHGTFDCAQPHRMGGDTGFLDLGIAHHQSADPAQVFEAVSVVPASIAAVLFPVLMKLGIDRWRETLRYMTILMGLALLVALVVGVFAGVFIDMLFGAKYLQAVTPLRIVLPAGVFVSGTSLLSWYLATHGLPRSTALAWLAAVATSIGFGPALVRDHGAVGGAIVLSCACAVAWVSLLGLSLRVARRVTESSA